MWDEKTKLYKIFEFLQKAIGDMKRIHAESEDPVVNAYSKGTRSIKFTFLIRKILEMKGDELYHCFPLPKTRETLEKYEKLTNVPLKSLLKNDLFISFARRLF